MIIVFLCVLIIVAFSYSSIKCNSPDSSSFMSPIIDLLID